MTREQAVKEIIRVLQKPATSTGVGTGSSRFEQALCLAIDALRGLEWVRTEDRLPTEEDGIIGGTGEPEVIAIIKYAHGYFPDMIMVSKVCGPLGRKYYPYWMPLPKLPEVEE